MKIFQQVLSSFLQIFIPYGTRFANILHLRRESEDWEQDTIHCPGSPGNCFQMLPLPSTAGADTPTNVTNIEQAFENDMNSSLETEVMTSETTQNGESHIQTSTVRPEVSSSINAEKLSATHEPVHEKTSKITEKTTKKGEVKPVKSNKKLKEEEKKLKLLFKSFEDVENPEAKLDALGRKHLQLAAEHKTTEVRKDDLEKRFEKVVKERDQLQSEYNKASLAKNKLESLCRELQRHSKLVKEESQLRTQEEEAKRKELSEKFQTTINDISDQMQENYKANQQLKTENNELATRLKGLVEQYEVREEHVEKVFKHKQLELQLAEAKMAQQHLQFNEDKGKTLTENQLLIKQAQEYQKQCEILTKQEAEMKSQLAMYAERFEEFQKTLNKSNEVFSTFKKEMDKMTKTIKKLEKEKITWKTKCENSNRSLVQMVDEREKQKNEMAALRLKNGKLENLCRALHKGAKVTPSDIDQAKETSSALSHKEVEPPAGAARMNGEKNKQGTNAGEEVISNKQTREVSEDETGKENENQSREQHSESSDGVQEPGVENSNKSDDSPANSETTPTVPADIPSNSETTSTVPADIPSDSETTTTVPAGTPGDSETTTTVPAGTPSDSEIASTVPADTPSDSEITSTEPADTPSNSEDVQVESSENIPSETEITSALNDESDIPDNGGNS